MKKFLMCIMIFMPRFSSDNIIPLRPGARRAVPLQMYIIFFIFEKKSVILILFKVFLQRCLLTSGPYLYKFTYNGHSNFFRGFGIYFQPDGGVNSVKLLLGKAFIEEIIIYDPSLP